MKSFMLTRMSPFLLSLLLISAMSSVALGQHAHTAKTAQPVTLESGLGDVDLRVSTSNAEAQKFFNQGMAYIYGFNHEEGIRSFKRAAELDPQLAMAYWGIALALGSNYNLQADAPQLKEAYANLQKAQTLAAKRPPGRSTRLTSESACGRSGMNWTTNPHSATSNDSSGKSSAVPLI